MRNRLILVALLAIIFSTGCLATVQQKAIRLAEITETGYAIVKADLIDWKARYDNISMIVALKCAENPDSGLCDRLAKADNKVMEAWDVAKKSDATAKELSAAKDELVSMLLEMEKALTVETP